MRRLFPVLPPSAICIGAQKAGTSALYRYLAQHPGVVSSNVKEIDFFGCDRNYAKGVDFYHSHFPRRTPKNRKKLTFDITPSYLGGGEVAAPRIYDYNPHIRLIALLREPGARAYSAWNMYQRCCKRDREWFYRWMIEREGEERAEACVRRSKVFGRDFAADLREEITSLEAGGMIEMPILGLGMYAKLMRPFLRLFSTEQILVLSAEEMKADTLGSIRTVEEFVSLEPHSWAEGELKPTFQGKYKSGMPPEARELLTDFYRSPNRELAELIGRELAWA